MDLGLFIAASGMVAEQTRQDQLSNDLANASTPGYKPDATPQHSFGELLLENTTTGQAIGSIDTGVALGKTYTDMAPAGMQSTNEPLDFAIAGAGFFAVQTSQGVRYTRDGQFTTSAQGQLVTATGQNVLGQSRTPIKVGADGTVPTSALGVFDVPDAVKQGENLFTGTAAAGAKGASGTVRQGVLEESAVNPSTVMVEMVGSLRTFQSGQQAIQAIDQTLQASSTQVGSLTGS
jgi:flagellar basal-body rod protein FlgF